MWWYHRSSSPTWPLPKKEGKFDATTYKNIYPSGSTTPTANPAIKAHKPSKDYPARLITSHIGAPQEHVAALINDILKPFIENSPYVCKNSFDFVEKIKTLKLRPHEKMISFDATALFPSVPINDAVKYILDLLERDEKLSQRTNLTPYDIIDLINICLSSSDFVYDNRHHTTEDSGPIGLPLMVTVSQVWMSHTMEGAIKIAKERGHTVPRNITIYIDDCWSTILQPPQRQGLRSNKPTRDPAADFNDCLNAVHERVQFTREEEENNAIAFLDVHITRLEDGKMTTKVYRKPSNTNIGLKPQSCQDPKTATASFKGELCRCYRLCSSPEQMKKEIDFALDLYEDNGHNRAKLKHIADTYTPPTIDNSNNNNSSNKNKTRHATKCLTTPQITTETQTKALFDVLPFINENLAQEEEDRPYACVNYIPGIAPQLKRAFTKAGVNVTFTSAAKLKDILCSQNKTHAPKEKKREYTNTHAPALIKLCTLYIRIGQTHRSCEIRWKEHERAMNNGIIPELHNTMSTAPTTLTKTISLLSITCKTKRRA